jgi:hypothetical protein
MRGSVSYFSFILFYFPWVGKNYDPENALLDPGYCLNPQAQKPLNPKPSRPKTLKP